LVQFQDLICAMTLCVIMSFIGLSKFVQVWFRFSENKTPLWIVQHRTHQRWSLSGWPVGYPAG